jgi:hypothetical protein
LIAIPAPRADFNEAERLHASPWVRRWLKHQALVDASERHRFPTM